ncbi:MAG: alpha/beta hydrolase, partial [Candidatus Omnitrophota bacterium]|nr:alpha/beta hydrolase [Candidatus Omnitrophota bacterium]
NDIDAATQYGYPYFPVSLLYQLQLLAKHLSRRIGLIKVPVQLIQAKDDDMTSIRNSKFIYEKIGSSMKEIVLLYNSYHVVTADQERDVVAAKMENFFGKII